MIKTLITLAGALSLIAPVAQADMLGFKFGIQGWSQSVDGGYGVTQDFPDYNIDGDTAMTGYVSFEHPLPLVPNVKLRFSDYDADGNNALADDVSIGGVVIPAGTEFKAVVDAKTIDYIMYYEVLDFDVGSLDLGLNVRQLDGDVRLVTDVETGSESLDSFIPMFYGAASTEFPFSGISAYGEFNYIKYDGSKLLDWQLGLGYKVIDSLALNLTAQLGYRVSHYELDDIDNIYGDLKYDGAYLGVEAHF
ncbi:TIGR04219 family outer membrane beta-barrel protein [Echinimonas agarilytica]|uniref:TIGR04219 family outer membrane beta-barrel protein n=1 Tax=Echinimonas agarilytica TaxID=1215918 RepID=A0AA41W4Q7_9GAMM|nr:TIGR04219 family outer membrane beta-barrel protein [Echinimonas agarilytica]MCM2678726.1 TIGR04219 family outer membrane beta-barrel protein [Echinimonas agarilytica]